ncbi:MAG: SEC-C metal-binding domain-containing protein [Acidobacteriota bacterium]
MKTARNSPCPCGSGMKYKECCGPKAGQRTRTVAVVVVLICVGLVLAGTVFVSKDNNQQAPTAAGAPPDPGAAAATQPAAAQPGSPQPPGPVPEGKVWSTEHGHWHDAPGSPAASAAPGQPGAAQPGALPPGSPQPPGPVPPGKVWSKEHGHWHDKP